MFFATLLGLANRIVTGRHNCGCVYKYTGICAIKWKLVSPLILRRSLASPRRNRRVSHSQQHLDLARGSAHPTPGDKSELFIGQRGRGRPFPAAAWRGRRRGAGQSRAEGPRAPGQSRAEPGMTRGDAASAAPQRSDAALTRGLLY